jgi:hypothetical protein
MTQSAQGKETFTTEDGENGTFTFYTIGAFNPATREAKSIAIAVVHTNSTGMLAPLNGTIVVGIVENIQPNGEDFLTLWEWQSEIQDSRVASIEEEEEEPPMNITTPSELPVPPTNMP